MTSAAARTTGRLVEVWAMGADGTGCSGSGWVVGHHGVLTCRHVVEPYLSGLEHAAGLPGSAIPALQIRLAAASQPSDWVNCRLAWPDPASRTADVVLLEISADAGQVWQPPTSPSPRLAALGQ